MIDDFCCLLQNDLYCYEMNIKSDNYYLSKIALNSLASLLIVPIICDLYVYFLIKF